MYIITYALLGYRFSVIYVRTYQYDMFACLDICICVYLYMYIMWIYVENVWKDMNEYVLSD